MSLFAVETDGVTYPEWEYRALVTSEVAADQRQEADAESAMDAIGEPMAWRAF
jgi:hypothetical protein